MSRFCGRYLNPATNIAAAATVCSKSPFYLIFHDSRFFFNFSGRTYPFRLGVTTDDMEICNAAPDSTNCELDTVPGGILGFALGFAQMSC